MSAAPALRPLPSRPSLEFERKEAKALLRRLRAGDPDALARARARYPAIDASTPPRIRLADAQLVIAREYGFASWPKLVRYFGDVERQRHGLHRTVAHRLRDYESWARTLLAHHRERRAWAARALAAYVPWCYAMHMDDVFAATVSEDDARLAVARQNGFASWEELVQSAEEEQARRASERTFADPRRDAGDAIATGNLEELERVVASHPELLHPTDYEASTRPRLLAMALHGERERGRMAMAPIVEWLVAQGLDLQLELNRALCGSLGGMATEQVRWLLDRGADPNWVAPTGVPVLEYALLRYGNGDAVDLVSAHTTPRRALWIAAGLGDVDGVRRSLDARGKPTPEATRLRPEFGGAPRWVMPMPPLLDADDEELLVEAFLVAMLNGRTAVLEYMISRGFPLNSLRLEEPLINVAVTNGSVAVVECLVRRGADVDLRGSLSGHTARELARELFAPRPEDVRLRRIVELLGMDPGAIVAERDARPVEPPRILPMLQEALELAGDDAFRLGRAEVSPENLLVGLLRTAFQLEPFMRATAADVKRFHADLKDRVRPSEDRVDHPALPLDADAQAAMQAAIAAATERRSDVVHGYHLLWALTVPNEGPVAELLARYGSSASAVAEQLERAP